MLEGWHFFFSVYSECGRRYCRYFVSIISPLDEDLYTKQVVCIKKSYTHSARLERDCIRVPRRKCKCTRANKTFCPSPQNGSPENKATELRVMVDSLSFGVGLICSEVYVSQ